MYLRNMKNYQSMNIVYTTSQGNQLWLGDYYAATNLQLLKQKNITSVFTTAAMLGIKYPKESAIAHKTINAFDIPTYKMTPHFDEAYKFIKDGLSKGNILVHCAAGISRSTTCVLVYLMRGKGYSFKQSLQMVKSKRPIINPNYGFQEQLAKYEKTLKKMKQKQEKDQKVEKVEKVEYQQRNNVQEEQKKAVMEFINGQKQLNKTMGTNNRYFGKSNLGKTKNESMRKNEKQTTTYKRGQSLNYRNTMTNNLINNGQKIHQQFLTFKLQQPKIVTIKK